MVNDWNCNGQCNYGIDLDFVIRWYRGDIRGNKQTVKQEYREHS